ncbi:glucosidase II beta subunit-like-domain-containing protein [Syncephalis pseudoplumigaleata]|uniref:Glucosidase 2 subunit beta n=1 Tax=Syncephalis pseudoplumigaleata TaxID=1712513 RepID=A0A4P9YYH5_9FUNG|nr:glucosidase II beta subunit-like-domain-containing protein [Syncephalis pseudoplumigaleata]|eukprot:RKP24622.1 glucosidase II beta subunit-like-domain-containing protein [Syncephalis pseudoplumigaleata]
MLGLVATASLLASLAADVLAQDDASSGRLRGVPKSTLIAPSPAPPPPPSTTEAAFYVAKDGMFTCLDGAQSIPFERVNDDYCDCLDGSDEPGTAACPNGTFHCVNRWFRPANIPSSRVNDGLCDPSCCDGSDEYDGKVQCPNRCKELGAADREKRKQDQLVRREGGQKRLEYMAIGQKAKAEREKKLAALRQEEQELAAKLDELHGMLCMIARSMDIATNRANASHRRAAAKEKIETLELAEAETPQARRLKGGCMAVHAPSVCRPALLAMTAAKERNVELERRIETAHGRLTALRADIGHLLQILKDMKENHNQNYHDMAVAHAITAYDTFETQRSARYEPENDDDLLAANDSSWSEEDYAADHATPSSPDIATSLWQGIASWVGLHSPSVDEVLRSVQNGQYPAARQHCLAVIATDGDALRAAYSETEMRKYDVQRELRALEAHEQKDYGPDQRFAALEDKCFSHDSQEYTYEVCLFDHVKQQKKSESWSTSLGQFRGWSTEHHGDDDEAKYHTIRFEDGEQCWDGPRRSMKIVLQCGVKEEILSVEETEKCVYSMSMTTPAVCPVPPSDASSGHTTTTTTTEEEGEAWQDGHQLKDEL